MKSKGFWDAVIKYFVNETGSSRGYASIVSKWKNRFRPRIGAFCGIIKNVEENHKSGTNDLDVYHKACAEYKMMYMQDFTLEHYYNILKYHLRWKDAEMPAFYNTHGRKKSKTSETTLGSSGGFNLNKEVDEAVEESKYVGSSCTTALNFVPWETDNESVLREACPTRAERIKKCSAYCFIVHESKNPNIQKNTVMESRNASFFEHIFPCLSKETGSLARLDDEVVQDKRQRDDIDL
ncbi:hypothetical protein Tco_0793121 [Tanacetum coccineum]